MEETTGCQAFCIRDSLVYTFYLDPATFECKNETY